MSTSPLLTLCVSFLIFVLVLILIEETAMNLFFFVLCAVGLLYSGASAQCTPVVLPVNDDFSGSALDSCWSWVNEVPGAWSLTERPGFMRMHTVSGLPQDGISNALLRTRPPENYVIETRLDFQPGQYQQAGLMLFLDNNNWLAFAYDYYNNHRELVLQGENSGEFGRPLDVVYSSPSVYLRMKIDYDAVTAEYSADGASWQSLGQVTSNWASDATVTVGLYSMAGTSGLIAADFDYVGIAPGQSVVCGQLSGVLSALESPYQVGCNSYVLPGDTLIVEPGVELRFAGHYKLEVAGVIIALGTEEDSIVFTRAYARESSRPAGIRINDPQGVCRFSYCIIEYGKADGPEALDEDHGGGLYYRSLYTGLEVNNSTFRHNYAYDDAGAMSIEARWVKIDSCMFYDNFAYDWYGGSGIGGLSINAADSASVEHSIFHADSARQNGGALSAVCWSQPAIIKNCVFYENYCGGPGDAIFEGNAHATNCIFWDNGTEPFTTGALVTYSDIQGGYPGIGNINSNPLFVNPIAGDFHLTANSPCIDAGDPTLYDPDCTVSDMGAFFYFHLAQPESLVVQENYPHVDLCWSVVDSTDCAAPSPIRSYVIYYEAEYNEDWNFLAVATDTCYRHEHVLRFAPLSHFYQVVATDYDPGLLTQRLAPLGAVVKKRDVERVMGVIR